MILSALTFQFILLHLQLTFLLGYAYTVPVIGLDNSVYPLKGNVKEWNQNEKYFYFNTFIYQQKPVLHKSIVKYLIQQ